MLHQERDQRLQGTVARRSAKEEILHSKIRCVFSVANQFSGNLTLHQMSAIRVFGGFAQAARLSTVECAPAGRQHLTQRAAGDGPHSVLRHVTSAVQSRADYSIVME